MKIFVLMPFDEAFDDVYHIIKDAVTAASFDEKCEILCTRADEISKPGRITDHILEAIRDADLLIVELTGNNANVMYELGFGHALKKPAIILNQQVHESPFDVKDFRQIVYERTRLLKECRPALIASIKAARRANATDSSVVALSPSVVHAEKHFASVSDQEIQSSLDCINVDAELTAELQRIHLELQYARSKGSREEVRKWGNRLLTLLGRVSAVTGLDADDIRVVVGVAGNCAVELEKAREFNSAEKVWQRCIGLYGDHEGIHLQYADFLADRGRFDEAWQVFNRGVELKPTDRRIPQLRLKLESRTGAPSEELGTQLKGAFQNDPSNKIAAVSYLQFLSLTHDGAEFERTCSAWEAALPTNEKLLPKRALADFLATSKDEASMQKALLIYEDILNKVSSNDRYEVLHNAATICFHFENNSKAKEFWTEAYKQHPEIDEIRAAFSQFLARTATLDAARAVAAGELLPERF